MAGSAEDAARNKEVLKRKPQNFNFAIIKKNSDQGVGNGICLRMCGKPLPQMPKLEPTMDETQVKMAEAKRASILADHDAVCSVRLAEQRQFKQFCQKYSIPRAKLNIKNLKKPQDVVLEDGTKLNISRRFHHPSMYSDKSKIQQWLSQSRH